MPDTEGPEKRNPGNREFMREKIVKQPLSKRQIAKRVLILMCLAVLFGVISAVSFVLAKPLADRYLGREETEESTSIEMCIRDSPYSSQRPFIVIFNLFTETLDMYVYSSDVTDIFITPDMIQELLPCKYLIG